ncbi:MAG TPA: alkaline phosphatase family protein [Planctomycetota bacterium]|nr:alkaline phosphatase family protein [Planctomycetota bacterium]
MDNQLKNVQFIVQLMLENRSFDQMLGFLYADTKNVSPAKNAFDGLTGDESNPDDTGREIPVTKIDSTANHAYLMPGADPGEGFYNTNLQLFGSQHPKPTDKPTNRGFVVNFKTAIASDLAKGYKDTIPGTTPNEIMGMYTPQALPVMSALARGFAVCDRWFASAPTQTIPNRAFACAGTSQGHLDNHVKVFTTPSIFGRLSDQKIDWAIYGYDRAPMTRMDFPDTIQADPSHFGRFADFQKRAAAGTLPAYTFLEPSFGAAGNSQHPNYDVAAGEQLIYQVYTALRNGKGWKNTLLLVTYDEHGGNFDHVAPPATATPPDKLVGEFDNFDFTRFGVRIPNLLISPLIPPGTVFRPQKGVVDHTSVLRTIELRWGLTPSLSARVAAAPSLGDVLTLTKPQDGDPLKGIHPPVSSMVHPNPSQPSELELIHAEKVSRLPIPDGQGHYRHTPPVLATSAAVQDYIESRTALWDQHLRHIRS